MKETRKSDRTLIDTASGRVSIKLKMMLEVTQNNENVQHDLMPLVSDTLLGSNNTLTTRGSVVSPKSPYSDLQQKLMLNIIIIYAGNSSSVNYSLSKIHSENLVEFKSP